jgi:hypothetical protein
MMRMMLAGGCDDSMYNMVTHAVINKDKICTLTLVKKNGLSIVGGVRCAQ